LGVSLAKKIPWKGSDALEEINSLGGDQFARPWHDRRAIFDKALWTLGLFLLREHSEKTASIWAPPMTQMWTLVHSRVAAPRWRA
jgi:hypothetical protein